MNANNVSFLPLDVNSPVITPSDSSCLRSKKCKEILIFNKTNRSKIQRESKKVLKNINSDVDSTDVCPTSLLQRSNWSLKKSYLQPWLLIMVNWTVVDFKTQLILII